MRMVLKSFKDEGDPRYGQKVDVLDLLINLLREHEEKLDEITTKLEIISDTMSKNKTVDDM